MKVHQRRRALITFAVVAALGALLAAYGHAGSGRDRPCPYKIVASPGQMHRALSGRAPACGRGHDRHRPLAPTGRQ